MGRIPQICHLCVWDVFPYTSRECGCLSLPDPYLILVIRV